MDVDVPDSSEDKKILEIFFLEAVSSKKIKFLLKITKDSKISKKYQAPPSNFNIKEKKIPAKKKKQIKLKMKFTKKKLSKK